MPLASDDQEGPGSLEWGMETPRFRSESTPIDPRKGRDVARATNCEQQWPNPGREAMWQSVRNAAPRLNAASIRSGAQWQATEPESVNVLPCSGMNW
jgi:hypothetical protein